MTSKLLFLLSSTLIDRSQHMTFMTSKKNLKKGELYLEERLKYGGYDVSNCSERLNFASQMIVEANLWTVVFNLQYPVWKNFLGLREGSKKTNKWKKELTLSFKRKNKRDIGRHGEKETWLKLLFNPPGKSF